MESVSQKKHKMMIGLVLSGISVVTVIVILFLVTGKTSIAGTWHNEELKQQLRFHEDGTLIITTTSGIEEANYVFDRQSGKGTISLNGKAISFLKKDGNLVLSIENQINTFIRGDMPIPQIWQVQAYKTETAS